VQDCWTDDEPGWGDAREELARAMRGGRRRWLVSLGLTVFVVLALVGWTARKQRTFEAAIVIRVVEETLDDEAVPRASGELARYISDVSLSRPTLLEVIETYELYRDKTFDINLQLEQMRDDIGVRVVQNYFSPEQYIANPVRSARIVLSYTGYEPDQAIAVARELGGRIADEQARVRRDLAQRTAASAEQTNAALRAELLTLRAEQARINLSPEKTALDVVQLARLTQQIKSVEEELTLASQGNTTLGLQKEFEGQSMGLRFEIVDPGIAPRATLTRKAELALLAILSFPFVLFVVAISVGTLDRKIHDLEAVRRLGLEPWGHIPSGGNA
jgi:uncharacterized protein involved in exopolysaccharide biosynthesis